ncbi:MAG: hypothetical protein HYR60_15675 [Acidobacteria bacterium]|nr:hypothetical protein [Acidobacteriota bacterium]
MQNQSPIRTETAPEAVRLPRRIALVHRSLPARFETEEEKRVMTFPHLIVRELIAMNLLLIGLALISLSYDAPLESLANPNKTPNPAKAPWYFLGLQELLHYFPPVVAGVTIPLLAVIALVAIPYFRVNMERNPLWRVRTPQRLTAFVAVVTVFLAILARFQCYIVLAPTLAFGAVMCACYWPPDRGVWRALARFIPGPGRAGRAGEWLSARSLAVWLMSWFLAVVFVLTITGTFFRGPGWSFAWPWQL